MSIARTFLFVPGDRPERFAKAMAAGADAVIIDLEDAVPLDRKAAARAAIADALPSLAASPPVWLRINAAGTASFADDLALAQHPVFAGLMLPKAESADMVRACRHRSVIALIESARGIARLDAIAAAPGMQRLAFGSIDFQADVGIPGEGDALLVFRSSIVLASRLANLAPPIDGVTAALDDEPALIADTQRARSLGFGGKLCIHPKQVAVVRRTFAPGEAEVAWARRVVAAIDAAGGAAVAVDGAMVDRPVLLRAQAILADAQVVAGTKGDS